MDPSKSADRQKLALQVSGISIVINILLSLGKLIAGFIAHSGAMVSDGVHSASDVISTVVVIIGIRLSGKKADQDHPYGHERLECISAFVLGTLLALTGLAIGISAVKNVFLIFTGSLELQTPGLLALIAALISIVVKETMYHYTKRAANKINSTAMLADAWHHRSDALSSVGSFIGVLGARLGLTVLDPIASIAICVFILKATWHIFKDAVDKLTDTACDVTTEQAIRSKILEQHGVERIDVLRTRKFSSKIFVDVEIAADGSKTLNETHQIAESVHSAVEQHFHDVKDVMVHVNPA